MKELIETELAAFTAADLGNVVAPEAALEPEAQGLHMFDAPLIGVAAAGDPLFEELRHPDAAGLGTFSLSKGLITERGMAGRFGSVVTDAPLPATERPYSSFDEYCILCGACIARCPVGAISLESGKDHFRCYEEMMASKQYYPGYLGCGKCQSAKASNNAEIRARLSQ